MDTQLQNQAFAALSVAEASTLDAIFEQLFPADESGPGASAIGVVQYLDRALSGPYAHHLETYRLGVYALDGESEGRFGKPFADIDGSQKSELIGHWKKTQHQIFRQSRPRPFSNWYAPICRKAFFPTLFTGAIVIKPDGVFWVILVSGSRTVPKKT